MNNHWFWFGITVACVVWYSVITLYVAVRGAQDIRTMLRRLRRDKKMPDDVGENGSAGQLSRRSV